MLLVVVVVVAFAKMGMEWRSSKQYRFAYRDHLARQLLNKFFGTGVNVTLIPIPARIVRNGSGP